MKLKLAAWLTAAFSLGFLLNEFYLELSHPIVQVAQAEIPKFKPTDPLPANLFVELAKAVNPAVVNIFTTYLPKRRNSQGPSGDPFFDLFQEFMGPRNPYSQPAQSLGTGFIIRDDGLIITNNHVVDRGDTIKVQLTEDNKEAFDAKVIGKDAKTDIALIKITTKKGKLPTVKLGTSGDVQVGEWVAAFGNPYGHGHTMTKGIISAIGREIDELNLFPFLQTDASINPGNSGGPLVNTKGEVIGVNSAIDARAQGIGFAIPIDNVKTILPSLENEGTVKRGFLGVAMTDIDEESAQSLGLKQSEGALVTQVVADSPADKAGLQPYDLIVEFDGKKISASKDMTKAVSLTPVGKKVSMKVIREGKPQTIAIAVGNTPGKEAPVFKAEKEGQGLAAPHQLGFRVADFSLGLAKEYGLAIIKPAHPIVTEVERNSPAGQAGLRPGDVILDINRKETLKAKDVVKEIRKGANLFRVLKQDRVVLISIRS